MTLMLAELGPTESIDIEIENQIPTCETANFSGDSRHEGGDAGCASQRGPRDQSTHLLEFPEEAFTSPAKRSRPSELHFARPISTTDNFNFSSRRSGNPLAYQRSCAEPNDFSSVMPPHQRATDAQRTAENGFDGKYLNELHILNGTPSELASRLRRNLWLATEYDWTTVPSKATEYIRNLLQQLTPPKELISVQDLSQINSDLERIFIGGFNPQPSTNAPVSDQCDCQSERQSAGLALSVHQQLPRIQDSFGPAAPKSDSSGCDGQLNTFTFECSEAILSPPNCCHDDRLLSAVNSAL
ncbi:unnamed protein product [Schistocephalus solidus]|uniref:Uncharacterized protein n=1 Tax=Schistocephalus solidus TaxID=70667 RepID=A0A183TEC3_SCHSO|nr:unnamed protein product [Schistocephalus solidus]